MCSVACDRLNWAWAILTLCCRCLDSIEDCIDASRLHCPSSAEPESARVGIASLLCLCVMWSRWIAQNRKVKSAIIAYRETEQRLLNTVKSQSTSVHILNVCVCVCVERQLAHSHRYHRDHHLFSLISSAPTHQTGIDTAMSLPKRIIKVSDALPCFRWRCIAIISALAKHVN